MFARSLTLIAFLTVLLALTAWLFVHDPVNRAPAGSIDRQGTDGLSLALAYLRAQGIDAEPLQRRIDAHTVATDAIVLRLTPTPILARPEISSAEKNWITAGGRLVVAENGRTESAGEPQTCLPLWPAVNNLEPLSMRALDHPRGAVIVRIGTGAMITVEALGAGELIRLTCADCLHDDHLGNADHLALLHGLAAIGSGRAVRFDEYALGRSTSPQLDLVGRLGLGPLLVLVAAIAGMWSWRRWVTNGPIDGPPPEHREDAIELVDSLGELLAEHLDDQALLDAYLERLRGLVARRSGLRGADLEQRLLVLLGPQISSTGITSFRLRLDQLNAAFERALHERPG